MLSGQPDSVVYLHLATTGLKLNQSQQEILFWKIVDLINKKENEEGNV